MGVFLSPRARHSNHHYVLQCFDQFWLFLVFLVSVSQLAETAISPGVHLSRLGHCQRVSKSSSHCLDLCSNLDLLELVDILLGFVAVQVAMSAGVEIVLAAYHQGIAISTGDGLGSDVCLDLAECLDVLKSARTTGSLLIVTSRVEFAQAVDTQAFLLESTGNTLQDLCLPPV